MRSPADILELISKPNQPINLSFGLRVFARALRSDKTSTQLIQSPEYSQIKDKILNNIPTMSNNEISDLSSAIREMAQVNVQIMSFAHVRLFLKRVDELIDNRELSVHQIFQLFNDISEMQLSNNKIEKAVGDLLGNDEITITLIDLKFVLKGISPQLHGSYLKLLKTALLRLNDIDLANFDSGYLIDIINSLARNVKQSSIAFVQIERLTDNLLQRIGLLSEIDLCRLLKIYLNKPNSVQRLYNGICEYVEGQLRENPGRFSEKTTVKIADIMTNAKANDLHVSDTIIEPLIDALGKIVGSRSILYYDLAIMLKFFSVFKDKVPPEILNKTIIALANKPISDTGISIFVAIIALNDLPGHSPDELFSTEEFVKQASNTSIYVRASGLAIASPKIFDEKWTQTLSEIEENLVKEAESSNAKAALRLVKALEEYPDVLYSSKLDKLKSHIFESFKELVTYPIVPLRTITTCLELAPWNQAKVKELISSNSACLEAASKACSKISDKYPFDSYIELLSNNPAIVNPQSLFVVERLVHNKASFESKRKLAALLENCSQTFLTESNGSMRALWLVKTLAKSNYSTVFRVFFRKLSEEFLRIDTGRVAINSNIRLANELRDLGVLTGDIAERIVNNALKKDRLPLYLMILNIASTDYSRFDEETIRTRLIHPLMDSNYENELIMALPSLLLWPHYEGIKEDEYTNKLLKVLKSSTHKNASKLMERMRSIPYCQELKHKDLYNKFVRALTHTLPKAH